MHATADTSDVMFRQRGGAARDAQRYVLRPNNFVYLMTNAYHELRRRDRNSCEQTPQVKVREPRNPRYNNASKFSGGIPHMPIRRRDANRR
jgi:hypothetical protein